MSSAQDHYSKSGMMIFILSMVISMGFFIYIAFVHPGVGDIDKLQDPPSADEVEATKQAKVEAVDPEKVDEPWVSSKELIAAGEKVYAMNCAVCHGAKGLADGPGANAETRNLVEGNWKAGGTSIALYKTLQNGLEGTGMVSFKAGISPANRWAVVHFVRSITENKIKDETKEEIKTFAKTAD